MEQKSGFRKVNNNGFSLLEVLIAVIIMGIISVPLLRAFGTSAQTNARAKTQMKASIAGENIMESIRNLDNEDIQKLIKKYEDGTGENLVLTTTSGFTFEINNATDFGAELPDGMKATVEFRTDSYPNANGLNLAEFEAISVKNCAIYTMPSGYDEEAYEELKTRNESAVAANSYKTSISKADIRKKARRTITLTIENPEPRTITNSDGEEVKHVRVYLEITYDFKVNSYLSDADAIYKSTPKSGGKATLFDNGSSTEELDSIYLFFYPRYSVEESGNDIINIINQDDIDANVYLTALTGGTDAGNQITYLDNKRLSINVNEKSLTTNSGGQDKGHVVLRTNILDTSAVTGLRTPYSTGDNNSYDVNASISYQSNELYTALTGSGAEKILTLSDIDGKKLYTDEVPTRIYKVTTKIFDSDGNEVVEFDGTKLNKY